MQIISTSPHRISLFGGGTDLEPFASTYGGEVINMAINLYTKIFIRPTFKIAEIGERHSGLGSSASYFVALMGGISEYFKLGLERYQIATAAFNVEVNTLGWAGGCQDQFSIAYGGFNRMKIGGKVEIEALPKEWAEGFLPYMALFDTGLHHRSFDIQRGLQQLTPEKTEALMGLKETVPIAIKLLKQGKYVKLGELLNEVWEMKKKSNDVTNGLLDDIYTKGLKSRAIGGKLIGAGQGGHFLFICKPETKNDLVDKLTEFGLKYVPFGVDYQGVRVRCEG